MKDLKLRNNQIQSTNWLLLRLDQDLNQNPHNKKLTQKNYANNLMIKLKNAQIELKNVWMFSALILKKIKSLIKKLKNAKIEILRTAIEIIN